jgi:tetratricopeptide (TPR) repeat protein
MLQADKTGAMLMAARREVRRGNREKARQLLQQVFAIEPTDCGALELLGDIFMEEGEQEKALKVFERGQSYHPRHRAFEEKIAVCHLDLAEMERDRILRAQVLETGVTDKLLDRKPGLASSLSLFLPGTGQFYNDDMTRGAIFLGTAILTFLGWYIPIAAAIPRLTSKSQSGMDAIRAGFEALSGFPRLLFWAMFVAWIATYIFAAIDGYMGAERANAERRRAYGL